MKKITKPSQREEALFFSDFSGKPLGEAEPITLKIECSYGSKYDGSQVTLHLCDEDLKKVLNFLKENVSEDFKDQTKQTIEKLDENFEDAIQFRDWSSCEYTLGNIELLKEIL